MELLRCLLYIRISKMMDKTEEMLIKRLEDLASAADKRSIVTFSDFLNLNELNIIQNHLKQFSFLKVEFSGGYELAERQIAAFIPDALYYEWDYPISCIKVKPLNAKFSDALTHRDYLGAILNLGLDRSVIGDILVDGKCAYFYCQEHLEAFILRELTRVKHTSVICEPGGAAPEIPINKEVVRGTVASIRLDSVISLACKSSRSSIVGLIEGGKVFVNGKMIVSNGYHLKEEDIISLRGVGKFRYKGILSQTKKERFMIEIEKYS